MGLPSIAVEKDWWVVHTLALIFSMGCAPALIFKGGTSLSKGWGPIQRFSEDIDLAIDRDYLGFTEDLNRQQIKKLRKASHAFLTTTFIEELTAKFGEFGFEGVTIDYRKTGDSDQDPIIIEIYYPKVTEKETYLKPGVLHEEFQKAPEKIRVDRLSRHLYDIEKLGRSQFAEIALSDAVLYQTIVDHRKRFTALTEVNYDNHSPDKIVFVPPTHLLPAWEVDYQEMRENMIYGDRLTFSELIEKPGILQMRINGLKL